MKRTGFSIGKFIWFLCCVLFALLALILFLWRGNLAKKPDSQWMAERWSSEGGVSQVSCFFSVDSGMDESRLENFGHMLENALKEESITLESDNESARLFVYAYSASGTVSVASERASLSVKALGVGGDFFLFHPQELLYGNYFSGSDLNQDYIIIDEETAWQLYGASDIAGKMVSVGGVPHVIAGVIRRPQGKLDKAAGLSDSIVYVSMSTLQNCGNMNSLNHYEIVMPDPISGYAMNKVKELLGADERETVYVENTGRFSILNSLQVIRSFGYRSMNGKAVIFPYWENIARGYEDILALMTLFMILCIAFPAVTVLVWLIYRWRHKSWTFRSVWNKLGDAVRIQKEKYYAKKRRTGEYKEDDYDEV